MSDHFNNIQSEIQPTQEMPGFYYIILVAYILNSFGILIWSFFEVILENELIPASTIKDSNILPFILASSFTYLAIHFTLQWFHADKTKRMQFPSKFEFIMVHFVGLVAFTSLILRLTSKPLGDRLLSSVLLQLAAPITFSISLAYILAQRLYVYEDESGIRSKFQHFLSDFLIPRLLIAFCIIFWIIDKPFNPIALLMVLFVTPFVLAFYIGVIMD